MFENISLEISASAVAWYGAVVATATAFITYLNHRRDRGHIKVKVTEGYLVPTTSMYGDELYIFIKAVNTGRRTITLDSVGMSLSDGQFFVVPKPDNISFPYKLHEGERTQIFLKKSELQERTRVNKCKIKRAWYRDSTGKQYSTRFKIKFE